MLKSYIKSKSSKEIKSQPSVIAINAILNYSKSVALTKIKGKKVMIHLN